MSVIIWEVFDQDLVCRWDLATNYYYWNSDNRYYWNVYFDRYCKEQLVNVHTLLPILLYKV